MVKIHSVSLKPYQKLLIILFSGSLTGFIVGLVLYLFNPDEWKILLDAQAWVNVMIFIVLGLFISYLYYKKQFNKLDGIQITLEENITLNQNDDTNHFPYTDLKHITLDMQFYYLFSLRRLNLYFEQEASKKLKIVSLLLPKEEAKKVKETLILKTNALK
ncbi:MAG: hypothetical protein ACLFRI_04480 [Candidatus Izemoplasmataceae bacterium]